MRQEDRERNGDMKTEVWRRHIFRYTVIVSALIVGMLSANAKNHEDLFVRCSIDQSSFYSHECVCATMWLYTPYSDIAFVNEVESPHLKTGEYSYISRVQNFHKSHREKVDGKLYYAFPLASFVFAMNDAGKYTMQSGKFEIGINFPVVYEDPFFGKVRTAETRSCIVDMKPVDFKVKSLPAAKDTVAFSGAVGKFSVSTVVPRGDIIVNEEASIIVIVKGRGLLGSDILPEYRDAFGEGNKLKSISEQLNTYFDGESIVSELELECEFVPTDIRNCRIGAVRFGYFNPETKRFEVAESEPVDIDVKSSAVKVEPVYI